MPIPVGTSAPVLPPPTPIVLPVPAPPTDAIDATWIAPDGTVWPLMNPALGWHTLDAVVAFGAAPVQITADPYARGGSLVRHIQPQPRLITWPLRFTGADHMAMLGGWRAVMRAFTQTRRLGPGTLIIARPDGTARQIQAYFQSGFEGDSGNLAGWQHDTAVITLYCPDPYWTDVDPTVITRAFSAGSTSFLNPFMTISSSQTLGDTVATNPGDIECWPEWTISGPASGIVATNNVTGESFTLDPNATGIAHGDLLLGEQVTITTNPPTVRGPDGSIWTAALNFPDAILWPLYQGDNDVTFTVTGSGAGSSVVLSFRARWESA